MTNINIPPEAVEAAARALAIANEGHDKWWPLHMRKARASIAAAFKAWPGVFYHPARPDEEACIFLPLSLPKENTNAEG